MHKKLAASAKCFVYRPPSTPTVPCHGVAHGHIAKIVVNIVNCPEGGVKFGFRAVSGALVSWGGPKMDPEWSRTLPKASQTPWEANYSEFLARISILTL